MRPMRRRDALGWMAGGLVSGCATIARPAGLLPAADLPLPTAPPGPLVQWCVAANGVMTDEAGAVSAWQDLSGHANHLTQATAAFRPRPAAEPVHGRPAIAFDGVGQFLDNPHLGEPACEIIVARLRAGHLRHRVRYDLIGADGAPEADLGAYYLQALVGDNDVDRRLAYVRPTAAERDSPPDQAEFAFRLATQPVIGAWMIVAVRNDGRTVRLYKSALPCGAPVPCGGMALQPITRAAVGCGFYGHEPADFAPVDIAKKLNFDGDLSDADFLAVINQLRERYDLGLSAASGAVVWPVFQANGHNERGLNENLVLLQGDGERFRYRPSHYLPPSGTVVRDPCIALWNGAALLVHTLMRGPRATTAFALAASRDGLASFTPLASVSVAAAVGDAADGTCWAPEFVRRRDNAAWLLDGRPVVLCNVAPAAPSPDNGEPSMQYYLFTPSSHELTAPWRLLGRLSGLPANIIDGFLFLDPGSPGQSDTWFVSVTPCNLPQTTRLYHADALLGPYAPVGGGNDPFGFGDDHEGTSVVSLPDAAGGAASRYFLDARGSGYLISDNPGLEPQGWSLPRPVIAPIIPQHGTPLPTPPDICTI